MEQVEVHFFNCTSLGLQDFTAISTTKKKENSGATAKEQSGIQICSERAEQKVQNSAEWIRMVQMCSALSGCFRNMKS